MKLSLAPLVFAGACAAPVEPLSSVEQGLKCDTDWMCGTNSPVIANYGFWELSVAGKPNEQGISIATFEKGSAKYELKVHEGRFIGARPGAPTLQNDALVGARLYLNYEGVPAFIIRIAQVETTQYWASLGNKPVELETYLLEWAHLDPINWAPKNEFQNLCSHADPKPDLGMNGLHTTIFEGERINAAKKTIDSTIETNWFNLGCAGSALAKLQLIGHTEAAKAGGFESTIAERQAALKMITGDYCGDGTPFTVAGQPLDWMDDRQTLAYMYPGSEIEARWNENGATCLRVPRIVANPTKLGDEVFPDGSIYDAIEKQCGLPPSCDGDDLDGHHLLSANPPPQP